jgi:hypothetical protein
MSDKKKIMFGDPSTWNNPDGSRMTVDQFMKAQDDYNNDPSLTDALVNTPYLDMPLEPINPKAIEDRQIKIDAKRELDKDLKQIRDNPVEYVQSKIDLFSPEDQENLKHLKTLADKKNVDPTTAPWTKQTVDNYENLKQNIQKARAMGVLPGPNEKALDKVQNKNKYEMKHLKKTNTWDLMLDVRQSPDDLNEMKRIINREFYKRGPKNLSEKELKLIGQHPSQKKKKVEEVKPLEKQVVIPQEPVEVIIKRRADENLRRQQEAYDKQYGTQGIVSLRRPI